MLILMMLGLNSNADLHGVRSSFLLRHYSEGNITPGAGTNATMYYLGKEWTDADRAAVRNIVKANGDTHIDLYTRSEPRRGGHVVEGHDFTERLRELNDAGLKPVLWLTPESKHGEHGGTVAEQKAYMGRMVARYDGLVAGYVVCLECDDYWSPSQVSTLIKHIKSKSDKPVAVHLTPGVGGGRFKDPNYYRDADYIYLQVGGHTKTGYKTADLQRGIRDLKEALKLGKPVVVSEYSMYSTSAEAKRFGDVMCANGAVGTGNGRNVTYCGQRIEEEEIEEERDYIPIIVGLTMVTLFALYDTVLTLQATDDSYKIGIHGSKVGITYTDDRVLMTYRFEF